MAALSPTSLNPAKEDVFALGLIFLQMSTLMEEEDVIYSK
jgi:hypothetical protein